MSDKLKKIPIGNIALVYNVVFMRTMWRESRTVVKWARSWVAMVENKRCHVVSKTGYEKWRVERIHLLKRMTEEESVIHVLVRG